MYICMHVFQLGLHINIPQNGRLLYTMSLISFNLQDLQVRGCLMHLPAGLIVTQIRITAQGCGDGCY